MSGLKPYQSLGLCELPKRSVPSYLPSFLTTYLRTYLPVYVPTYVCTYLRLCLPTSVPTYVYTYLCYTYQPTYVCTYLNTYLPTYVPTPTFLPTYVPTYVRPYLHLPTILLNLTLQIREAKTLFDKFTVYLTIFRAYSCFNSTKDYLPTYLPTYLLTFWSSVSLYGFLGVPSSSSELMFLFSLSFLSIIARSFFFRFFRILFLNLNQIF